jgi:hypothetical protein
MWFFRNKILSGSNGAGSKNFLTEHGNIKGFNFSKRKQENKLLLLYITLMGSILQVRAEAHRLLYFALNLLFKCIKCRTWPCKVENPVEHKEVQYV